MEKLSELKLENPSTTDVTSALVASPERTEDPGAAPEWLVPAATRTGRTFGGTLRSDLPSQCSIPEGMVMENTAVPRCAPVMARTVSAVKGSPVSCFR